MDNINNKDFCTNFGPVLAKPGQNLHLQNWTEAQHIIYWSILANLFIITVQLPKKMMYSATFQIFDHDQVLPLKFSSFFPQTWHIKYGKNLQILSGPGCCSFWNMCNAVHFSTSLFIHIAHPLARDTLESGVWYVSYCVWSSPSQQQDWW